MFAGETYNEEKQKKYEVNSSEKLRDRKKYEKKIEEALGSFKVVSFYDNLYHTVIQDDNSIKVPNYPVIKSLIENELRKQIEQNNSKTKLSGFVTIVCLFTVGDADEKTVEVKDFLIVKHQVSIVLK